MAQRSFIFLVVCLLMFYGSSFGQKNTQKNVISPIIYSYIRPITVELPKYSYKAEKDLPGINLPSESNLHVSRFIKLSQPVPATFYTQCLGFICRKEWQLDKISPVIVRFRLGSLEQVNWLEQKPNSRKPY